MKRNFPGTDDFQDVQDPSICKSLAFSGALFSFCQQDLQRAQFELVDSPPKTFADTCDTQALLKE
jgi:hypothetical protein